MTGTIAPSIVSWMIWILSSLSYSRGCSKFLRNVVQNLPNKSVSYLTRSVLYNAMPYSTGLLLRLHGRKTKCQTEITCCFKHTEMVPMLNTLHTHAVMYPIHVCVRVSVQEQVKTTCFCVFVYRLPFTTTCY